MSQSFEPIDTVLGIIKGRDAIFLDDVIFDYGNNQIELRGEFNSNLCSNSKEVDAYIGYSLTFAGLLGITMIELDLNNDFGKSSFARVINSVWINEMRLRDHSAKVKPNLEHYFVASYDDVFNIACETFELKILNSRKG
jgi:hypothetical protein